MRNEQFMGNDIRMRAGSGGLAVALCCLIFAVSGCASTGSDVSSRIDRWATAPDQPCQRLSVGWPMAADLLQEIVGPNFAPARVRTSETDETGDMGQLLVLIVDCPASRIGQTSVGPLTVAQVVIPLSSDRTSRIISGVTQNGWWSAPLTVAGEAETPVTELFRRHGFTIVDGRAELSITSTPTGYSVEASLLFAEGRVTIQATIMEDDAPLSITTARVATGADSFAAFSGDETATRHPSGQARVEIIGDTPLSDLQLAATPPIVMLDKNFMWDFTFWHEAIGQE